MNSALRRAATACWLGTVAVSLAGCGSAERRGEELYELHCAECHEMPNPELKKPPPQLEGLFHAKTLPSGVPATDAEVKKTILQGLRTMPAFDGRLSEDDVKSLVAYLHTLK